MYFNLVERLDVDGSKATANFILKCKLCDRTGYIDYCPNTIKKYSKSESFASIVTLECRNIEIVEFVPKSHFHATGTEGDCDSEFHDIDLGNEPDWAGYDEQYEATVGVYELKT